MLSPLLALQHLQINTSEISELWQAAKLSLKLGRLNQSLTIAYNAVQKNPAQQQLYHQHYIESMRLGAEFAEEIGDNQRSAYYWEQVTQQVPQDAIAWHGLGIAKANLQDYQSAEFALSRALQLEPGNQKIRMHLTEVRQLLGVS
ncbi:MAG: tetratricopeptide repeat protein [Pelatocladus maniniholoensis HA4357-MV3]|jgi:Flp pilus assembly protein TadD|uniref:Tetratricopeptide repeat protein n=1 Tax=Pelatocladus maniniholoensis HA4357-MV3 TaxID=1117104 RepID=A0A9E3H9K6_9NOST|nr:tetratricopeptide repeat protein [Pelatocladus maniniholoensis HA4357-MV3]